MDTKPGTRRIVHWTIQIEEMCEAVVRTARTALARDGTTYTHIRLVIVVELALSPLRVAASRVRRRKFTGCAVTAQNAEFQQRVLLEEQTDDAHPAQRRDNDYHMHAT